MSAYIGLAHLASGHLQTYTKPKKTSQILKFVSKINKFYNFSAGIYLR